MTIESDLKAHLQAASAISAIVDDRITPLVREEGSSSDSVTYSIIAGDPMPNLDGSDSSLANYRVQIDSWSRNHSTVMSLAAAISARMGIAADTFRAVKLPTHLDDFEFQTKLYRRMLEFSVWHRSS
jgi:hypothetical protein